MQLKLHFLFLPGRQGHAWDTGQTSFDTAQPHKVYKGMLETQLNLALTQLNFCLPAQLVLMQLNPCLPAPLGLMQLNLVFHFPPGQQGLADAAQPSLGAAQTLSSSTPCLDAA